MTPFLKWPGGKRWVATHLAAEVSRYLKRTYYEPFLGGGALFFALKPEHAILADINEELINAYRLVQKGEGTEIVRRLQRMPVSREYYYRLRRTVPTGEVDRAVRFMYLNRTAFGGIYRLNRIGQFNVPYGGGDRTPSIIWERDLLTKAKDVLVDAEIHCRDFGSTMQSAGSGDVVYCDPTYTVAHNNNGFVRYNERNFSWADQERLAVAAHDAAWRGATVLVSSAQHDTVRDLYPTATVRSFRRRSLVSRYASGRRDIVEMLFILRRQRV